jgi:NAD(P)-dependent dehydrogenase (short-subunit alcohol dehydrogenase family)
MSRIAVVAGGSAGVGRATVDALLDRGYRVAVFARGRDRLDEMDRAFGERILTQACDVGQDAQVQRAADEVVRHWGEPEVWINCAMLTSFSSFEEMTDDEFRKITDTTYMGQVNGTRAALRVMSRGNIVNVGSGIAYRAVPFQSAYSGAKHAINGFTQAIRSEVMRSGRPIEISLVQLPAINTPQFDWARNRLDRKPQPAPPIYQPEVAAKAVMKAIDGNMREVFVGRSVPQLVFGNMLFPDLLDRALARMGREAQRSDQPDFGREDNIDGPVEGVPAKAHGSFDHRAEETGMAVDGDAARMAVLFGSMAALVGLGAIIGRASAPKRPARRSTVRRSEPHGPRTDLPWGYDRPPNGAPAYHRPDEYRI